MTIRKTMVLTASIVLMFVTITAVSSVATAAPISQNSSHGDSGYQFMPWVCQFCGSHTNYTRMIEEHHNLFTDLSYEQYYLASNGTFQKLDVPNLIGMANQYHLAAYPMIISSDPSVMHLLFTNSAVQSAFISAAVQAAVNEGYAGYNIDFEVPYYSDSANVTAFVSHFSNALLAAGKQLTLDVIGFHGYSPQAYGSAYNYSALSNTSVSLIVVEDYYAASDFMQAVNYSVAHVAMDKLMIALPDYGYEFIVNATSTQPFPDNLIPPYVNYSYSGMYGVAKNTATQARTVGANVSLHYSNFYAESYYEIVYPSNKSVGYEYYYVGHRGMEFRLNYLESLGIHKAALWRAGSTDPAMWSSVHQYKKESALESPNLGLLQMPLFSDAMRFIFHIF